MVASTEAPMARHTRREEDDAEEEEDEDEDEDRVR